MNPAWKAAVDAAAAEQPTPRSVAQEVVPSRVCHIDGDYLAYFASGNDDTAVGTARMIAKNKIEAFQELSGSAHAVVHLTASGSSKGERFFIATVKPYQGQRHGRHPKNWYALREYLESAEYAPFKRTQWYDREADDGMALASYSTREPPVDVAIATKDKDMRMLPGVHIDWSDYTLTHVPKGTYELIGSNGLVFGTKWFWLQMLQGDTADHIPGLERYLGKTIGEKTAADLLAGTTCNEEAFDVVSGCYMQNYTRGWEDRFVEQAALLWLRTTSTAPINDMLRVVPATQGIRNALSRLTQRVKESREAIDLINARAASNEDAARAEQL